MGDERTYGATVDWPPEPVQATGCSPGTLGEAIALHAIEGDPLDAEDIAVFEMFEREGWPPERRRAYIIAQAKTAPLTAE